MSGLYMEKLLKHPYILASLCITSQISFGQESYPKQCSSVCLEYSKAYSAQNSETYRDYCAINWEQIKNLPIDSRKSDASAFARNVASGSGTLRDKALQCLYSGVESGNGSNGSRVGTTSSTNQNVKNHSNDQSQQNQAAQQQSQQAQQQAQQTQQLAAQNQTRADQARQGQRRRHEPENEAHECLSLDRSPGFGGFVNKCNFKVSYSFCTYNPKKDSWAEAHDCVGRSGNSDFVGPGRTSAAHTKNTETVYWFACKDPAWSLDTEYVPGQGLRGRCYTVGGK